ncbi:hypothetical protein H0N95_01670 [Candidatus Micrarchaeota archaeon]|nr:hypothetical protein [Candidatus Micrarchaeota archaeon]
MNALSIVSGLIFTAIFLATLLALFLASFFFGDSFYYVYLATAFILPFIIPKISSFKTRKGEDPDVSIHDAILLSKHPTKLTHFALPKNLRGVPESVTYNAITFFQLFCFMILIVFPLALLVTKTSDILYPVSIVVMSLAGLVYSYYKTRDMLTGVGLVIIIFPVWIIIGALLIVSGLYGRWVVLKGVSPSNVSDAKNRAVFIVGGVMLAWGGAFATGLAMQPGYIWLAALFISWMNALSMTKLEQA